MSTPPGPDDVTLEDMTEADLPVVARLEASLFGAEAWSQDLLAAELAAASGGDRRYVVARGPLPVPGEREDARGAAGAESRILGYAGMWVGDSAGDADLLTIATIPQARRRKVASRLLTELMDTARRAGCRAVLLEVRASNTAAQSLYAAHGFTRIGLRRRYYWAPQEDAVVMRALLRPAPAPVGS